MSDGGHIERAFKETTAVVFGKQMDDLKSYEKWLLINVPAILKSKSVASNKIVYAPRTAYYSAIADNVLTNSEALEFGNQKVSENVLSDLHLSNIHEKLHKIAVITPEVTYGNNYELIECTGCTDASFCSNCAFPVKSRYSAYSFWPRESEYVFGCSHTLSSTFCIKCYYSSNLTRCFEMSDCNNCRDSYFCYNSENLSDCMFCFNSKAKSYAIGNVEVGREKYMKIKGIILDEIVKMLEKDKKLDINIYNLNST